MLTKSRRLNALLEQEWLKGENLERRATAYAVEHLVPRHLERVRQRRIELIDKTEAAVQERLTKEINYWDLRAAELRAAGTRGQDQCPLEQPARPGTGGSAGGALEAAQGTARAGAPDFALRRRSWWVAR